MTARFKVEDAFNIEGRGHVLAGQVLEGTIKIGMHVLSPFDRSNIRTRIKGVEMGHKRLNTRDVVGFLGLLLDCVSLDETRLWNSHDIKGQTLEIQDE